MKIDIRQLKNNEYIVDLKDLPGSPYTGNGFTPEYAVACLFFRLLQQPNKDWIKHIQLNNLIVHSVNIPKSEDKNCYTCYNCKYMKMCRIRQWVFNNFPFDANNPDYKTNFDLLFKTMGQTCLSYEYEQ